MKRLCALLVAVALVTVGCASQRFNVSAVDLLRTAAKRTWSAEGAALRGSMTLDGTRLVTLTGVIEPHDRDASVVTADAHDPAGYPPFEARFVGGSTYVAIGSGIARPDGLSPSANWVAFAGERATHRLPIPSTSMPPGYVFTVLDQLLTHPITHARTVDNAAGGSTTIEFQLPDLKATAAENFTVSIDSSGRIGNLVLVLHAIVGKTAHDQETDLTFVWGPETAAITAPPTDQVQRLAPGDNLYPNTTTTTTTPGAIGSIDESDAIAGNKAVFDGDQAQLAAQLRAQPDPRLAAFTYDTRSNTIAATFSYARPGQQTKTVLDGFAWHVGQTLADTFWSPGLVQAVHDTHGIDSWLPKLRIELGTTTYLCPAVAEIALDARQTSEADWLGKCAA